MCNKKSNRKPTYNIYLQSLQINITVQNADIMKTFLHLVVSNAYILKNASIYAKRFVMNLRNILSAKV